MRIAVVIPAYKCSKFIVKVCSEIDPSVEKIFVVDDCCPEHTGKIVAAANVPRVQVLFNKVNLGVGGAVKHGYQEALAQGLDICIKMDGDGQMDPRLIPRFIRPIIEGHADYTKGNRFYYLSSLYSMPRVRVFGNTILSLLSKLSTGYYEIFDPTNGYTAISTKILPFIEVNKVANRYFFESDLLFRLNLIRAKVEDVPMDSLYGDEISGLKEFSIVPEFLKGHIKNFLKRLFYQYFLRNFSPATLELIFGIILLLFGLIFGTYSWVSAYLNQTTATSGTVMLSALPFFLGFQLLLSFIQFDVGNSPKESITKKL